MKARFDEVIIKGRKFFRPDDTTSIVQKRFKKDLSGFLQLYCEVFSSYRNPYRNRFNCVVAHRGNRYIYQTDIKSFFSSIFYEPVLDLLREISPDGYRSEEFFPRDWFFHKNGGLVIGANASPILAEMFAFFRMDLPLIELCKRYEITYTRFVDDLIFSSASKIGKKKRKAIREIIRQAGLDVNHGKSRVIDLEVASATFLGVGLDRGGRVFIPRKLKRRLRGMLRNVEIPFRYFSEDILHGNFSLIREIYKKIGISTTSEEKLHDAYLNFLRGLIEWREQEQPF